MYGKAKFDSVNEVCHLILQSKCDEDISIKSLKSSTMDLAQFKSSKACLKEYVAQASNQTRI